MWNWKVRELADKVANVVMNYTEVEAKVREATNDDAWGPTGALMQEIAQATFTFEHFPEVMSMLWKRMLQDNRRNWRRTYKSLLLLAYLVKNGSERVVTSAREHIYDLRGMENYTLVDETGKDQGINVRVKVRELIDFIQDDDRLREERKKAKKNKDKYVGMSSDSLGLRYGGDRWDDVPRWNKEDTWADSCKNPGNNSGVEEEPYHNHSGDDSDGGFGNERKEGGGGVGRSVYRDNDSSVEVTGGSRTDKVVPKGGRTKTSTPSRKIDLGAAASFGRESYSTSQKTSPTKQASLGSQAVKEDNLLGGVSAGPSPLSSPSKVVEDDDFDPRANETTTQDEFQDFTSASGNLTATPGAGDDDFADFNAFNEGNNNIASLEGNNKLNLQQPQNKQSNSNIMGMQNGHNPLAKGAPILQPIQGSNGAPQQSPSLSGGKMIGSTWTNSGGLDINIDNLSISGRAGANNTNSTPMNQMVRGGPSIPIVNPAATPTYPVGAMGTGPFPGAPMMGGFVQGIPIGVQQPLPQQQQVMGVGPTYFPAFK
ncbi:clathrin interactor 1 isoform X3 [Ischnura elegans]|uniref:clathrin interactor 1 isoform X3 n=1 Tax=Ischnura elegans TaxID=197161 RepID=UPI001ED8A5F3|nr:clathrin interactor 1 isoform X3 [Ischnura elegans]